MGGETHLRSLEARATYKVHVQKIVNCERKGDDCSDCGHSYVLTNLSDLVEGFEKARVCGRPAPHLPILLSRNIGNKVGGGPYNIRGTEETAVSSSDLTSRLTGWRAR